VVFATMTFPSKRSGAGYVSDAAGLLGKTFREGLYYPLPLIGCTLTSGEFIGWVD